MEGDKTALYKAYEKLCKQKNKGPQRYKEGEIAASGPGKRVR